MPPVTPSGCEDGLAELDEATGSAEPLAQDDVLEKREFRDAAGCDEHVAPGEYDLVSEGRERGVEPAEPAL